MSTSIGYNVLRLGEGGDLTTNVHTKHTLQIYEKLSYEALNRHYAKPLFKQHLRCHHNANPFIHPSFHAPSNLYLIPPFPFLLLFLLFTIIIIFYER